MYLSEARAVITPEAHAKWAKLIEEVIFSQPEIAEAFQDPRRIFNNVSFSSFILLILDINKLIFYENQQHLHS